MKVAHPFPSAALLFSALHFGSSLGFDHSSQRGAKIWRNSGDSSNWAFFSKPETTNSDGDQPSSSPPLFKELSSIERVFCLSDLHTDHVDNMEWVRERMRSRNNDLSQRDLIVVAGDISHHYDTFSETLGLLRERCQVFFVPGNHEAWINRKDPFLDSIEKMDYLLQKLCEEHSVFTGPLKVSNAATNEQSETLCILPLECWYDGTLSFSEELCADFGKWPWVDFQQCVWPDRFPTGEKGTPEYRLPKGLVEFFLKRNEVKLQKVVERIQPKDHIMTVSHFLPNRRCLPDWKDLEAVDFDLENWLDHGGPGMSAKFAKVAGTSRLDDQIRSIMLQDRPRLSGDHHNNHIHVFGHSHRPKDFVWDCIRYVHNPLGKPRERNLRMISPGVDLQLLWDHSRGEVPGETILRYWEEKGGGKEALWRRLEASRPAHRRSRYKRR